MLIDKLVEIFRIVNNMKILNYTDRYFFLCKIKRRISDLDKDKGKDLKIRPTRISDLKYEQ